MVHVAETLEGQGGMTQDGIFDGSFVNAWDVGNLVADYLVFRTTGGEGCDCNTNFEGLEPISSPSSPLSVTSSSSPPFLPIDTEFERQRFLGLLLDGETPLQQTHDILRSCLTRCSVPDNQKKKKKR